MATKKPKTSIASQIRELVAEAGYPDVDDYRAVPVEVRSGIAKQLGKAVAQVNNALGGTRAAAEVPAEPPPKTKGKPRGIKKPTLLSEGTQLSVRVPQEIADRLDACVGVIGYGITRVGLVRECVMEGLAVIEERLRSEGKLG